jgi:hypothetical protein
VLVPSCVYLIYIPSLDFRTFSLQLLFPEVKLGWSPFLSYPPHTSASHWASARDWFLHKLPSHEKIAVKKQTGDALFAASAGGYMYAAVLELLSHKDINVSTDGQTPHFAASWTYHEPVVRPPSLTANNSQKGGWTELFAASRNGQIVNRLLNCTHIVIGTRRLGGTPCRFLQWSRINLLFLCTELAVNTQTGDGWKALIAASCN